MRNTLTIVLGLLIGASLAAGQTTDTQPTNLNDGLAERTPAENVTSGSVSQRAPGNIINAARAAHAARSAARLAAQRAGDVSSLAPEELTSGSGSSSSGGGLTDLVGDLLGSVTGLDVGNLLGGLGGGSVGTGTSGTGTGTTGGNVPSNITPEAIALLEANGFDVNELFAQTRTTPDDKQVTQTTTVDDDEPRFLVRWADSILQQMFFALTTTLNSSLFVDFLVENLSPPDTTGDDNGTSSDTDDADGTPVDVDRDPNSIVRGLSPMVPLA